MKINQNHWNRTYIVEEQLWADCACGNGTLKTMSYGTSAAPLATVSYDYDKLDRVKTVTYDDTNSNEKTIYGYNYSSDGDLSGITANGDLRYAYTYDTLGRLIYSSKLDNGQTVLYTQHQYDTSDRVTAQNWQIGNDSFSESYTYNTGDGTLASMTIGSGTMNFTYNQLNQLTKRSASHMDVAYTYGMRTDTDNSYTTTGQIATIQYVKHGTTTKLLPTLGYTYDSIGNITEIKSAGTTSAQYTYDSQNQMTQEVLTGAGSSEYTYDTYGNIRERVINNESGLKETFTYTYRTSGWLDQLTQVTYTNTNGTTRSQSLTYDAVGNPLNYYNGKTGWTFTWKNGRQLATAVSGNTTITNTYDVDGIRDSKTVGNIRHEYVTMDGKVVREVWGTTATIDYLYDNNGKPYQIRVKEGSNTYTGYFALNQQGDVIAIVSAIGDPIVTYKYDAWGRQLSATTSTTSGAKLYTYNRLKYRSYYYDSDLLMYDLGSRFYDPVLGRFLNADALISGIEGELLGYNLYAYCFNNPANGEDEGGSWPKAITGPISGLKTVLNHLTNICNKVKISRELKLSYTKEDAKKTIDEMLKDYSKCKITFEDSAYKISNSYQVKSIYERQKICMIVKRTGITERSVGNMSSEWLFHNIVYDMLEPLPDFPIIKKLRDKAVTADIEYIEDGRRSVRAVTKILEIWGYE